MRHLPDPNDDLDLALPALDGEGDTDHEPAHDALDVADDDGDAFDDSTGEDTPFDAISVEGAEEGWLLDAENANSLDLGPFDVLIQPEGKVLGDDEPEAQGGLLDLIPDEVMFVADAGEEGPLADDDELREEDLPALDADEDGEVSDEELFDRNILASDDDLRWDDRAWARAVPVPVAPDEADDSGGLAVPGYDSTQSVRDAAWKGLEQSGHVMAAALMPGGSVVVALSTSDRARASIVRILPDGQARIIAEVDSRVDDDGEVCTVTFLRWDAASGCLVVGGSFGVEAYRPV